MFLKHDIISWQLATGDSTVIDVVSYGLGLNITRVLRKLRDTVTDTMMVCVENDFCNGDRPPTSKRRLMIILAYGRHIQYRWHDAILKQYLTTAKKLMNQPVRLISLVNLLRNVSPFVHFLNDIAAAHTRWPKKYTSNFCPYRRQILTDFEIFHRYILCKICNEVFTKYTAENT